MQRFKCLIVDDEVLAQDVIEKYIQSMPMLELSGKCNNAIEAIAHLHEHPIDLLFLDINMPEISGLDMLKTLQKSPKVILTTAYSEFALESYEYGVVDYLLKPIKLDRFIKAVNRALEDLGKTEIVGDESAAAEDQPKSLFVKEDQITYSITFSDISHIEAYGNYLKIFTAEKTYVIRETMQQILTKIPEKQFIRVHKSFIVSLTRIKKIVGNQLFIDQFEVPVGTTFKSELTKKLYDN